jgi:two-component system, chemotaxis family, protein-glutamate methylesterase/glutaminase
MVLLPVDRGALLSSEQRIVVVGASAGGIDALLATVPDLPEEFPAPIFVVIHIPSESPSLLADILQRRARVRVEEAEDGKRWKNGVLYVASPDRHLTVDGPLVRSTRGPRENRHRPAIDPLFFSAALHFGPAAVGVVLSGTLDDGTAGAAAIKRHGGTIVVQDPREALFASMPSNVIEHTLVDHVVTLDTLVPTIARILEAPLPAVTRRADPDLALEVHMATLEPEALEQQERPGRPSPYSCPDCGGVLWEIDDKGSELTRFRCRVGHAFSPETMITAQSEQLEEALWSAVKTLEETVRLSHRLATSERQRGHEWMAARFEEKEREAKTRVEAIRRVLGRIDTMPDEAAAEQAAASTGRTT